MASEAPKIAIVILNWNGCDDTIACLGSVARMDYPNYEIIVADNGSVDESVKTIRSRFPTIELIETGENLGYAGGNNVGIRVALERGADFVLLLNNDTEVDDKLVAEFVGAANSYPEAGVFSARIYYHAEPTRVWHAGTYWDREWLVLRHVGEGESDDEGKFGGVSEVPYACGCAMFLRANALRQVGLLDEGFFLIYEEVDWCYRARSQGFKSIYVPSARLWHKVSVSFGGADSPLAKYFSYRNYLLWARRHVALSMRMNIYAHVAKEIGVELLDLVRIKLPAAGPELYVKRLFWAIRDSLLNLVSNYRKNIVLRAKLFAIRDYILGRFGDCPEEVRKLPVIRNN